MKQTTMNEQQKTTVLFNILGALCEIAERDATVFLPQNGNEIDYQESINYLAKEIGKTARRLESE